MPKLKVPKIDRETTVNSVVEKIGHNFPTLTVISEQKFLMKSRKFIDELRDKNDVNAALVDHTPNNCSHCSKLLEDWTFQPKHSFLLSMGHVQNVNIPVKFCSTCKILFYPGMMKII